MGRNLLITLRMVKLTVLNKQSGYTLTEVLLVLTVFSISLILVIPLQNNVVRKIETQQYMEQFQEDILLAQQLTMTDHPNYWIMIRPAHRDYYLYDYKNKLTIYHRKFPDQWKINLQSLTSPIRFNAAGTLRNPGTMTIVSPYATYKITFPFGKSRVSIIEQ